MPSKAQIKAQEAFVKKYAKKKKGSKTKIVYRLGGQKVSKKEYLNRERKFKDPNTMKRPKDESDKLYEADRREWNRLQKLAKKKGW